MKADPEALHQAVAVIDSVLADLDAGRISGDTAAKTIGLKVLTAREVVLEALHAPQNGGAAAGEWKPMATAPKDGVTILAGYWRGNFWCFDTTRWEGDGWWQMRQHNPTHWQASPSPPALAQPDASQEPGTGGER